MHPLTQDGGLWYFEGGYDQTVHLLPTEAVRVVPDAQHQVLQTLSLVAAILVTRAATATRIRAIDDGETVFCHPAFPAFGEDGGGKCSRMGNR